MSEPSLPLCFDIEPVIAWRKWYAIRNDGEWQLRSVVKGTYWPAQKRLESHVSPDQERLAGIHAIKDPEMFYFDDDKEPWLRLPNVIFPVVYGHVALWGRVIEGERGYRAQYAYPQEAWVVPPWRGNTHPSPQWPEGRRIALAREVVQAISRRYAIPCHLNATNPL